MAYDGCGRPARIASAAPCRVRRRPWPARADVIECSNNPGSWCSELEETAARAAPAEAYIWQEGQAGRCHRQGRCCKASGGYLRGYILLDSATSAACLLLVAARHGQASICPAIAPLRLREEGHTAQEGRFSTSRQIRQRRCCLGPNPTSTALLYYAQWSPPAVQRRPA